MKKLLFVILAIMLSAGIAFAVSIPSSEKGDDGGPYVWSIPVYNNSGGALSEGDVVVWDIGSSTGDKENYITTTTTAATGLVAGIVYKSAISAADTGMIAIRGVVPVNVIAGSTGGGAKAAGSLLCSSTTAGRAINCSTTALEMNAFAIVTEAPSSQADTQIKAFISAF